MKFSELGLIAPILNALEGQGYTEPTPIQRKAIPPALSGRDVLGCAQTGTGKTCAFATPILQRLNADGLKGPRQIRALILTPTRELALQIQESFEEYGANLPLRSAVIFGGVGQAPQVDKIRRGLDILVATPGRLLDLQGQGLLDLSQVKIFVLDEADRMLDMGFIHDVRRVLKLLPDRKQTLFFSATMPPEVTALVNSLLRDPVKVAVDPVSSPVEVIDQSVYLVDKGNKSKLLAALFGELGVKNALIFTRTKHGANKVAGDLVKAGISAAAIHGNKSQTARQQALSDFKEGKVRALVATDIAARGLDIEELSHVVNYNLPEVPETYIHRIGRTGRAGRGGTAIAFCDFGEKAYLKDVEKLIGKRLEVIEGHSWPMEIFEVVAKDAKGRPVNADDAEARAAARERRRLKDEAARGLGAKRVPVPPVAPAAEAFKSGKAGNRRKNPAAIPPVAVPGPEARKKEPRWQKAEGERAKTLDAVLPERTANTARGTGNGDFYRPDPLASDRIMDATARLLAPRPRPAQQKPEPRAETPAPRVKVQPLKGAPVPQKEHTKPENVLAGKNRRNDRGHGRRGGPPAAPVRSGSVKDSTEQPSLMKPYYLERD